jgi:hypothetical protein
MPAAALYRGLLEKSPGRVVHSDLGWADDAKNQDAKKNSRAGRRRPSV